MRDLETGLSFFMQRRNMPKVYYCNGRRAGRHDNTYEAEQLLYLTFLKSFGNPAKGKYAGNKRKKEVTGTESTKEKENRL